MKTSDKIKSMPTHEQSKIIKKLLHSHGEVNCLNEHCDGEYYRTDRWTDTVCRSRSTTMLMCYDCDDILFIVVDDEHNEVLEIVNLKECKGGNI